MDIEYSQGCESKKTTSENALLRGFLDLSQTFALKVSIEERLNEISAKICSLLDLKGCRICFLTDNCHLELTAYHGLSQRYLDKGSFSNDQITIQCIESGKPVIVPDTSKDNRLQYPEEIRKEGICAIMTFPVFARGDVIGVLRLFSDQPRELSHEEVQLISTISDRIGIAFKNAKEKDKQQRQIEYLTELQNLGKVISSTRSLQEVLDHVAKAVVNILDLKGCLIRLYNPMKRTLELKMSMGLSQDYLDKGPIDARTSLTKAMGGEIVEIFDAQNDPRVQYREEAAREGIGSMVSAPMLLKDKAIGVLRLFTSSRRTFSQEELSFIAILTDQCAAAVENARYFENLKFEYESVLRDTQRKTILEVRELRKSFLGVEVLKGVDFVLKEGEIHALLGANGAGKSTLIKILTGVYSMTSGRILFEGQEIKIKDTQTARSMGFSTVYQDTNLIESMSIGENIMMGSLPTYGPFRFLDRNQVRKTVQPLLQEIKLTKDIFNPVGLLTPGEKQMVMLAKILYEKKKIVILDEPTTSLTGAEIKTYLGVLRKLRSQGLTVIYISHMLDEVFETCDRITIIKDGRKVATKRVDELDKFEVSRLMVGRDIKTSFDTETCLTSEPVLKITNLMSDKLSKPFNLEVRGGEIVGIVGARGSGEEELVRLILGLGNRLQGEVSLDSIDISGYGLTKRISKGIGFIPPDRLNEGIFPNIPCVYNLTIPAIKRYTSFGWVNHGTMLREAVDAIGAFKIKVADPFQEVRYLSGGNQQKIMIAKWINAKSRVFLMCDPTSGVDVGAKDEIYELGIKLAREGSAVLFVSHDLEEVFKVCHRVIVFHKGESVYETPIHKTDQGEILYYLMGGASDGISGDGIQVENRKVA